MSNLIEQLASASGRKDELLNQELAASVVAKNDTAAVEELVDLLQHKSKDIQSDAIKVLYEIGEQNPAMIAAYSDNFLALLNSKNNRLVWGAMTALDCIAVLKPEPLYKQLPLIIDAAAKGSVIVKDHFIGILIKLISVKKYEQDAMILLLDQLKVSATNQLPMYAEQAMNVVPSSFKPDFIQILTDRLPDIEKESKRKRVEKVIRKLQK